MSNERRTACTGILFLTLMAAAWTPAMGSTVVHTSSQITPPQLHSQSLFGAEIVASNDDVFVGAPWAEHEGTPAGKVFQFSGFENPSGPRSQVIESPDLLPSEGFGEAISVSGNRLLVGAPHSGFVEANSGAAYVFEQNDAGGWLFDSRLLSPDIGSSGAFGFSVAIDGDDALVSAPWDYDSVARNRYGAVHAFRRDASGEWQHTQRIETADRFPNDLFGRSVALSGKYAAISAPSHDDGFRNSGAVFMYEQASDGMWEFRQKITPQSIDGGDHFGWAIDLDGTTLFASAPEADSPFSDGSGAVFVFERGDEGVWAKSAEIAAEEGRYGDWFGNSLDRLGSWLVVGAQNDRTAGQQSGAAYLFHKDDTGAWIETAKLTDSSILPGDWFGSSVTVVEHGIMIGAARGQSDASEVDAGTLYTFSRVAEPASIGLLLVPILVFFSRSALRHPKSRNSNNR